MKHTNKLYQFTVVLFVVCGLLLSCEKATLRVTEYDLPDGKAFARFALLSPGTTASVMIKVNDKKINGNFTSLSSGVFPINSNVAEYAAIEPNGSLRLSIPNAGTLNDSVLLFSGNMTTAAGKFYSVVLADSGVNRTLFTVEDNPGNQADSGFLKLRFINATAASTGYTFIRVDSTSATQVMRDTLFRNVAFRAATDFVTIPISSQNANLRYRIVETATGNPVGAPFTPGTAFVGVNGNRRCMTIYSSGRVGTTFTPGLSIILINK
jgi:hypothetical protein